MVFGDRYTLELPLGEGELGTVWLARDKDGARVVVATLEVSASPEARARFEAHAKALVRISHPNVVRGIEEGVNEEGEPYLVMEKLEGETLAQRWASGAPLRVDKTIEITTAIVSALGKVHAEGIAHGDIEPGNVYLVKGARGDVVPKLIGFGLNRVTARNTEEGRVSLSGLGAFAYAAPEQVSGKVLSSSAADLYSAAAILYAGLAGRTPHQGISGGDLAESISMRAVPTLATIKKELTAFSSTLDRALQNDPAKRFADAAAFERGLRAALAMGRIVGAKDAPTGVREAVSESAFKASVRPPAIATASSTSPGLAPAPRSSSGSVGSPMAAPRPFLPPPPGGGTKTGIALPPPRVGPSESATTPKKVMSVPPPRPRDPDADSPIEGIKPARPPREDGTVPLELDSVMSLGKPPPTPVVVVDAPRESLPSELLLSDEVEIAPEAPPPPPPSKALAAPEAEIEIEAPAPKAEATPVETVEAKVEAAKEPEAKVETAPVAPEAAVETAVESPLAETKAKPVEVAPSEPPPKSLAPEPTRVQVAAPTPAAASVGPRPPPAPHAPRPPAAAPSPIPTLASPGFDASDLDDEAPRAANGPPSWLIGALGGAAVCLLLVYVWMQFRTPEGPTAPEPASLITAPVPEPVAAPPAPTEPAQVAPIAEPPAEPVAPIAEPVAPTPVVAPVEPIPARPTTTRPATTTTRPTTARPTTTTRPATRPTTTTRPATRPGTRPTGRQTVVTDPGF